MHVHGSQLNPAAINLFAAAAEEKAAAAKQAAEVRKKLLSSAAGIGHEDNSGIFAIREGSEDGSRQSPDQNEQTPNLRKRKSANDDEETSIGPVSVWC